MKTPCSCQRTCLIVYVVFRLEDRLHAVEVAVKLRSRRKKVVFGAPICRGYTPDFGHTFSNRMQSLPNMWPVLTEFRSARKVVENK